MLYPRHLIGRLGEDLACSYLLNKHYVVIERNYRNRWSEIDIVAQDRQMWVFVEVRTRNNEWFGRPEESFKPAKLKRLKSNAAAYVFFKKYAGPYRIDAICLVINSFGKLQRLNHYQNII